MFTIAMTAPWQEHNRSMVSRTEGTMLTEQMVSMITDMWKGIDGESSDLPLRKQRINDTVSHF